MVFQAFNKYMLCNWVSGWICCRSWTLTRHLSWLWNIYFLSMVFLYARTVLCNTFLPSIHAWWLDLYLYINTSFFNRHYNLKYFCKKNALTINSNNPHTPYIDYLSALLSCLNLIKDYSSHTHVRIIIHF